MRGAGRGGGLAPPPPPAPELQLSSFPTTALRACLAIARCGARWVVSSAVRDGEPDARVHGERRRQGKRPWGQSSPMAWLGLARAMASGFVGTPQFIKGKMQFIKSRGLCKIEDSGGQCWYTKVSQDIDGKISTNRVEAELSCDDGWPMLSTAMKAYRNNRSGSSGFGQRSVCWCCPSGSNGDRHQKMEVMSCEDGGQLMLS